MACSPRLIASFMAEAGEGSHPTNRHVEQARQVCEICPSLGPCRRRTARVADTWSPGMIAGMSRKERRELLTRQ